MSKRNLFLLLSVVTLFLIGTYIQATVYNIPVTITGPLDASGSSRSAPAKVATSSPGTCTIGDVIFRSDATAGQNLFYCTTTNNFTQQLNSGTATGGGITMYSATGLTVTANTYYIPLGGGGSLSTTEANVDIDSPAAATITNMYVQLSVALGMGNSGVFTMRKNGASQSVTCTISGASATNCSDTTHSFAVSQGDLLTIQLVTTGTIVVTPNILIAAQFGNITATGTVNSGTATHCTYYAGTGTAVSDSGAVCPTSGTVATTASTFPFTQITTGTNTVADAICGSGCTIEPTTGIVTTNAHFPQSGTGAPRASIPISGWTIQNGANAHCTYNDFLQDDLVLSCPSLGNQQGALTRTVSVPYTIYALLTVSSPTSATNSVLGGITLSDGTKYESISVYYNNATNASVVVHTQANLSQTQNTTQTGSAVAGPTINVTGQTLGVKIVNNSTNRVFSYWAGGAWTQILSETSGTFLTETAAGMILNDASLGAQNHLTFWSVQ